MRGTIAVCATVFGLMFATSAWGQGAPSVSHNSGALGYVYPFDLPAGRGTFQPSLALVYSSLSRANVGYGYGWDLTSTYIETRSRTTYLSGSQQRTQRWLVYQGSASLLVSTGAVYRPEIASGYLEVTSVANGWQATDAVGNRYEFSCVTGQCTRWYLTKVTDPDQNVTRYDYEPEGLSASAKLSAIRYNAYPDGDPSVAGCQVPTTRSTAAVGDSGCFATTVTLTYQNSSMLQRVETAGALVDHVRRLNFVSITNASASGPRSIGSYIVSYEASGSPAAETLTAIAVMNGAKTTFGYPRGGVYSSSYEVAGATNFAMPTGFSHPTWIDMDGDGRPDLVQTVVSTVPTVTKWARNITEPGAAAPVFAPPRTLTGFAVRVQYGTNDEGIQFTNPNFAEHETGYGYALRRLMMDVDGDGLQDIVTVGETGCSGLAVRFGQVWRSGDDIDIGVGDRKCLDMSRVFAAGVSTANLYSGMMSGIYEIHSPMMLRDVTGDGIADFILRPQPNFATIPFTSAWIVFPGFRDASTGVWGFANGMDYSVLGYGQMSGDDEYAFIRSPCHGGDAPSGGVITESAFEDINGDGLPDRVCIESQLATAVWNIELGVGNYIEVPYDEWWNGTDGPGVGLHDVPKYTNVCGWTTDDTADRVAFVDLNGDGLPDHLHYLSPGQARISWNNGRRLVAGPTIAFPDYPFAFWRDAVRIPCGETPLDQLPTDYRTDAARGVDALVIDVDGDGTVDYVRGASFYRGTTNSPLLSTVESMDGAIYSISYAPSTLFAASPLAGQAFPVVSEVTLSGVALEPSTVEYWYRDLVFGRSWFEPDIVERRGFREFWSRESVTGGVQYEKWEVDSHAFAGRPLLVESGTTLSFGPTSTPPTYVSAARSTFHYGARSVAAAGCVASTDPALAPQREPAATQYPLIVFGASENKQTIEGSSTLASSIQTYPESVDGFGNAMKVLFDPDLGHTGDEVLVENVWYSQPNQTVICKTCPQLVWWKDPVTSVPIQRRIFSYTANGHPVGDETAGGVYREYYADGNLARVTDAEVNGTVATQYTYDVFQLRVEKETIGNKLVKERLYNSEGRLALEIGPYSVGSTAAKPQVGYLYDALGRLKAVTRGTPTGTTAVNAIQAFAYDEVNVPHSVTAYSFATPRTFDVTGPMPVDDGVTAATTYRDGLGRSIQTRQRLGTGLSAPGGAGVTQGLAGFRVTDVVVYDGAGRPRVTLTPFLSMNSGYQDYRVPQPADLAAVGVRGTVTSYDSQGRAFCVMDGPVRYALPAQVATVGQCVSTDEDGLNYRRAQLVSRSIVAFDNAQYLRVTTSAPEGRTTKLFDASGQVQFILDASDRNATRFVRDRLGREAATVRQARSASGVVSKSVTTTTAYDLAGRVASVTDAHAGTRTFTYDGGGRVTFETRDSVGIKTRYTYGDLNRLTKIEEVRYEQQWLVDYDGIMYPATVEIAEVKGEFKYDQPYGGDAAAYTFTAGRLAWISNSNSTIAFGYDDVGAGVRRDQWVAGIQGRMSSSVARRNDGAVLTSSFGQMAASGTPLEYSSYYDSAGRPVRIATDATTFWEVPGSSNYDALDRPSLVKADDGRASTARMYSPYSGLQTADIKTLGASLYSVQQTRHQGTLVAAQADGTTGTNFEFSYDANGRLARALAQPTNVCAPLAQGYDETFGFNLDKSISAAPDYASLDSIGNIEAVLANPVTCQNGTAVATGTKSVYYYSNTKPDQVTSIGPAPGYAGPTETFAYDGWGRIINRGNGRELYTYDASDRLLSVTRQAGESEILRYDPSGELVSRQIGNKLVVYVGADATIAGYLPAGCASPSETCQISASGQEVDVHINMSLARIASVGATRTLYYYRDRQGSVVATSLAGGIVGARYRFSPYGVAETLDETSANASERGYTNSLRLTGGLLHLKTRVYDPTMRRFLQADTVDALRYAYVGGDPVNFADPSGRQRISDFQRIDSEGWALAMAAMTPGESGEAPPLMRESPLSLGAMLAESESSVDRANRMLFNPDLRLVVAVEITWMGIDCGNGPGLLDCRSGAAVGTEWGRLAHPFTILVPAWQDNASTAARPRSTLTRPGWGALFKESLFGMPEQHSRQASAVASAGGRLVTGSGGLPVTRETVSIGGGLWDLAKTSANGTADEFVTPVVFTETAKSIGARVVNAGAGAGIGIVGSALEGAAYEATFNSVAFDVYVVLSRNGTTRANCP